MSALRVVMVDFFIIGAQKSGTTTLAAQLARHPQISFCRTKEPNFFSLHGDWREHLDTYHALFDLRDSRVRGEASTTYAMRAAYPETASRISTYNPDARVIFIMRHPVDRILSHYAMKVRKNRVEGKPDEEIRRIGRFVEISRYALQLEPYLTCFARDQIHLMIFEEFVRDQQQSLQELASFLGVDGSFYDEIEPLAEGRSLGAHYIPSHIAKFRDHRAVRFVLSRTPIRLKRLMKRRVYRRMAAKPEISPVLRDELWKRLEPEVRAIEQLMGRKISSWRKSP